MNLQLLREQAAAHCEQLLLSASTRLPGEPLVLVNSRLASDFWCGQEGVGAVQCGGEPKNYVRLFSSQRVKAEHHFYSDSRLYQPKPLRDALPDLFLFLQVTTEADVWAVMLHMNCPSFQYLHMGMDVWLELDAEARQGLDYPQWVATQVVALREELRQQWN